MKKIQDAAKLLKAPAPALSTGSSFKLQQLSFENEGSSESSRGASDGEAVFKKPKLSITAVMGQELAALRKMMEEQKVESEQQKEKLEMGLKQQREESQQQLKQQLKQQREESRQQLKEQRDQLTQIIELLKARKD